jgi:hypothetical protein
MPALPTTIGLATAVVVAGTSTGILLSHGTPSTHVLGERIVGAGSSVPASNQGSSNVGSGSGGGGGKGFSISGSVNGLYPGNTVQLHLTVSSALNQDMNVNSLSAVFSMVVKAPQAPAGTCTPALTIGSWTGTTFRLPKNTLSEPAPGYIPVTLAKSASDACQGATFDFTYSGSGSQA